MEGVEKPSINILELFEQRLSKIKDFNKSPERPLYSTDVVLGRCNDFRIRKVYCLEVILNEELGEIQEEYDNIPDTPEAGDMVARLNREGQIIDMLIRVAELEIDIYFVENFPDQCSENLTFTDGWQVVHCEPAEGEEEETEEQHKDGG